MTNLINLQSQIEKLQLQAQKIKEKETATTIQDIVAKMRAYGITDKDLRAAMAAGKGKPTRGKNVPAVKKPGRKPTLSGSTVAPKYRGPNGESWTGRGLTPKWLASAIAEGKTKEDFLINAPSSETAEAPAT